MKKTITTLIISSILALSLKAEEIRISTVDMAKLYNSYYKTQEANEKIQESAEKAKEQAETLVKDGQELVEQYQEAAELANSPALSEEARSKAQLEAKEKLNEIQEKERDVQQLQVSTQRSLQQRQRTYRDLFLEEIKSTVMEVANERGSNLILDSSGITALGLPTVLQADSAWDITDVVLERINADAPLQK